MGERIKNAFAPTQPKAINYPKIVIKHSPPKFKTSSSRSVLIISENRHSNYSADEGERRNEKED